MTRRNRKTVHQPKTYFCSRCGKPKKSFRWEVIKKPTPANRCSDCGGNLVKQSELAPELQRAKPRV